MSRNTDGNNGGREVPEGMCSETPPPEVIEQEELSHADIEEFMIELDDPSLGNELLDEWFTPDQRDSLNAKIAQFEADAKAMEDALRRSPIPKEAEQLFGGALVTPRPKNVREKSSTQYSKTGEGRVEYTSPRPSPVSPSPTSPSPVEHSPVSQVPLPSRVPEENSPEAMDVEDFLRFDEEDTKEIMGAVGATIEQTLEDDLKDFLADDTGGFEALGPGFGQDFKSKAEILSIISKKKEEQKKFHWSGIVYEHEPGTYDVAYDRQIADIAEALLGDKFNMTLYDEADVERKGGIPIRTAEKKADRFYDISFIVGEREGMLSILSVSVELKNPVLAGSMEYVQEFVKRAGMFIDDVLPYMLVFSEVREKLGSRGLENDLLTVRQVYSSLLRRYTPQRDVSSPIPKEYVEPQMPEGIYSVTINNAGLGEPLVRILLGCDDIEAVKDFKAKLGKHGFKTHVHKYADEDRLPRAFELYMV